MHHFETDSIKINLGIHLCFEFFINMGYNEPMKEVRLNLKGGTTHKYIIS